MKYTLLSIGCLLSSAFINAHANNLLQSFYDHDIVKRGSFTLRSGKTSSVYIDARNAISSPQLLATIAQAFDETIPNKTYDRICGVPYGALPFATALSLHRKEPMIMLRKEIKNHGTQKQIEGQYAHGDTVLLVEDVITTGSSILEAVTLLEEQGLIVKDIVILIDRQDGGVERLRNLGYSVHAMYTLTDILAHKQEQSANHLTYAERACMSNNAVAQKLFAIMEQKQTNLAVALDVTTTRELLTLAEQLGPHICLLKIHVDIITDFTPLFIEQLLIIAKNHNFLIMADRKFSDIGNTTQLQYTQGIYHIAEWADLVTVQALPGAGVLTSMQQAINRTDRAAVLITQMSSQDNLADNTYTRRAITIGNEHTDFVAGLIARTAITADAPYLFMTPGIHLDKKAIADQTYLTPHEAICKNGTDIIIVGRAIYESCDPVATAVEYKNAGWSAYQKRIQG